MSEKVKIDLAPLPKSDQARWEFHRKLQEQINEAFFVPPHLLQDTESFTKTRRR